MTFGHQPEMHTLPIGVTVRMDADEGCIELLSPAVY
jgi:muramoyltetrapeptide carboxypeptidase LdcA involved in peptidoglycan recycling